MPDTIGNVAAACELAEAQMQAADEVLSKYFDRSSIECTPERMLAVAQIIAINMASLASM